MIIYSIIFLCSQTHDKNSCIGDLVVSKRPCHETFHDYILKIVQWFHNRSSKHSDNISRFLGLEYTSDSSDCFWKVRWDILPFFKSGYKQDWVIQRTNEPIPFKFEFTIFTLFFCWINRVIDRGGRVRHYALAPILSLVKEDKNIKKVTYWKCLGRIWQWLTLFFYFLSLRNELSCETFCWTNFLAGHSFMPS